VNAEEPGSLRHRKRRVRRSLGRGGGQRSSAGGIG